jgi:hypothetical protein
MSVTRSTCFPFVSATEYRLSERARVRIAGHGICVGAVNI